MALYIKATSHEDFVPEHGDMGGTASTLEHKQCDGARYRQQTIQFVISTTSGSHCEAGSKKGAVIGTHMLSLRPSVYNMQVDLRIASVERTEQTKHPPPESLFIDCPR